jgi:hypothetical protein
MKNFMGRRAVVSSVNDAFARFDPGEREIGSGLPVLLEEELNAELNQPTQPEAETAGTIPGDPYEYSEQQVTEALKKDWGESYEFNMQRVKSSENAHRVFGEFARTDQDRQFVQEFLSIVGNHPSALKLYHHILKLIDRY